MFGGIVFLLKNADVSYQTHIMDEWLFELIKKSGEE